MKDNKTSLTKKIAGISRVGAQLFSKKGYMETSLADIAVAMKLSKGGIYHYFPSKTELLSFIIHSSMDQVLKDLKEELGKIESPQEKIKRLIVRHVELYIQHMYEARTLLNETPNLSPTSFKKIVVKQREYYQIAASVLSDYLGASASKDEIKAISFTLFGMCNWIYSWYDPKGPIAPEQLSQIVFDLFINGVSGFKKRHSSKTRG
ncbi:MAG: HTH-type transcriptional repressor KstR2 [Syntrophorhabdus sp. PtaU1.Bin058]|nr:MAG: HTH-type transcriptional repressor KstR2 [Syntrophorhabdus sp. PtaU1.Bin058]